MTSPHNIQGKWQPQTLILANLFAIILFASWLLEPTRSLWLELDSWAFWAMNNSLAEGKAWQWFWAISNNRAFDLVPAFFMLLLYGHCSLGRDRQNLNRYIAIGILLLITVVVASQLGKAIPIKRPSATFHFPEALRISQLVPEIITKDTASDSFPGDHGLILLLYAGFVAFFMPRRYGIIAALMVVPFTLPRLMSGAHWLTDEIVGAIAVAAVVLSWIMATPLHTIALNRLEGWVSKVRDRH
ncbi:MAG: phosphatase PAP2 family protein [Gammaproteobacteria bacterium]|nr:phosphatase PAP2 family protein [Gammaproteobacteria bacterium]